MNSFIIYLEDLIFMYAPYVIANIIFIKLLVLSISILVVIFVVENLDGCKALKTIFCNLFCRLIHEFVHEGLLCDRSKSLQIRV